MCPTLADIDDHLETRHGRVMIVETFHLQDNEALELWLCNVKETEFAVYNNRSSESLKTQTYICHPSGQAKKHQREKDYVRRSLAL